jgi:hypothetical protein
LEGVADRGADGAAQAVELGLGELAGGAAGVDPGLPQALVGQQVADAGDHGLVHQARLDRRFAAAGAPHAPLAAHAPHAPHAPHAAAELGPCHDGRIGAQVREVGFEPGPAEAPLVAQREPAAVVEAEREPIPALVRLLVDHDPSRHPEVQSQGRAIAAVGLEPQRLADPVGARQPMPDERGGELPGGVRPAHVAVAVLDRGDAPAERAVGDQGAGTFGFG